MKTTTRSMMEIETAITTECRRRGIVAHVARHWAMWGDVRIVHPKGTKALDAHMNARGIPGFDLVQTIVDGWGNIVSLGHATGAF